MNSETVKKQENHDIYTVLRDDIMGLRLKPGIIFSIKDICELYQSGRHPCKGCTDPSGTGRDDHISASKRYDDIQTGLKTDR